MITLLQKEKMLYESIVNKAKDKDFMISFYDYFSFIEKEGINLCSHLNDLIRDRNKEENDLENLYIEIIESVKVFIKDTEVFLKKENLEEDSIFKDRLKDTKSLVNNTMQVLGGNRLDSIHSEMSDITRRLKELGFDKELSKYVDKDRHSQLNTEDIIALKKRKQFIAELNNFNNKDARSLAGAFEKLLKLYANIKKIESNKENEINMDTFFSDLHERNKNIEYTKLMSGEIDEGLYFRGDKYISDIERFHQSIIINNQEIDNEDKKEIFYLDEENIYHHKIGRMIYNKKGLGDPKYIIIFKKIIQYMPANTHRIRINEFEKILNNNKKSPYDYRANIGKSAKSFNSFLKKNGVQNVNSKTKEIIINATDNYIDFNNLL